MYMVADSVDDLMHRVIEKIISHGEPGGATKGKFKEKVGVLLKLRNPRARLSATERKSTLFSCVGELLWYLSASNRLEPISYYLSHYKDNSDDDETIHGAYGPRLLLPRGQGQLDRVLALLRDHPSSRRAVIQLFRDDDLPVVGRHADVPCTCTLQFVVRGRRLNMLAYMRSNDVFLGLPHDLFAFTMLQELVARSLGVEVGAYTHCIGSLHLYDRNLDAAQEYLDEGWQEKLVMPAMPVGDPWASVSAVLDAEARLREGRTDDGLHLPPLDPYWRDIVRLLEAFSMFKRALQGEPTADQIPPIAKQMVFAGYKPFIEQKYQQVQLRHVQRDQSPDDPSPSSSTLK